LSLLHGKSLLITGGTGSFGQTFVRLALNELQIGRIVVYSRDELKQIEMARAIADERVEFVIGDVRDKSRLKEAMRDAELVVHAAALKQVPVAEKQPQEAVKTNVLGAINMIEAARESGVSKVIALSTDKAAHPVNLYGASKMVAEKLFIAANAERRPGETRFSVVRYGNVVASRGSVIPLFAKQREQGVIYLTHPQMTRFWITLEQGTRFVARCLEAMQGGEVFIPKMPSARILDLAHAIAPGCRIEVTRVRPGEKLHEVLVTEDESFRTLEFDDFFIVKPEIGNWNDAAWQGGRPLPAGYRYASNTNPWRLSVDEIRQLLEGMGYASANPL